MGMDSYFVSTKQKDVLKHRTEIKFRDKAELDYFYWWRNDYKLHNWMENLYRWGKEGNKQDFNCIFIELNNEDLEELQEDIENGFVYEYNNCHEMYDAEYTKLAIKEAKKRIKDGKKVFFVSWY